MAGLHCAAPNEPDPSFVPEAVGTIAFVDVAVVPMTSSALLEHQTIVISGDRITAMGPAPSTAVPSGATIIATPAGAVVAPGLADMHVHSLDRDELLLYLANGVTTIRNLHGLRRHLAWRDSLAQNTMVGPRLLTSGPILESPPLSRTTNAAIATEVEATAAVDEQAQLGFDYIKIYDNLPIELYRAVGRRAKARGLSVIGHLPNQVALDGLFAEGVQDEVEHLEEFLPFLADGRDDRLVDSIARSLAARGIAVTPTASVFTSALAQAVDLTTLQARPELAYVNPATVAAWGWEATAIGRSGQAGAIARYRRTVEFFRSVLLPAFMRAHVTIVAGTDAPIPMIVPGFGLHDELDFYRSAGMTPFEVIRTATVAAAGRLPAHLSLDALGTVGLGAPADIVLLAANPLDDVGNLRRRWGVVARGRWYSQARLQQSLDSLAGVYRAR